MKQTYGRRDRREDAIRTWLPAYVLFLGRQSEGCMALMSKFASVLRCPGVVKRTWAIFATYVRYNRPQSTMRFWQSSHRTLPGATIGGSMCLMSKCASVLRCSGVVKRTWAIYATYVRCNRPQSTLRFWQSSHRSLREIPCWPHGVSASCRGRSRRWNEVTGVVVPQHPIEFWHSNQE